MESGKPKYDLEERTFQFAKRVRLWIRELPGNIPNQEDIRQLVRASASVGANYIEANEALSKKDFKMRIKISRKESKECAFFIRLLEELNTVDDKGEGLKLVDEATQLKKIFSAILEKSGG